MKSLPKIAIWILLFSIGLLWGRGFTTDLRNDWDCDRIITQISKEKTFPSIQQRNNKTRWGVEIRHDDIIDSTSINTALLNLKKTCCSNEEFEKTHIDSCTADKELFLPNSPRSYFLLDHIFDVLMRRLDGIESYQGITLDAKGVERREFITEIAIDPKGTTPANIDKTFRETRAIDTKNLLTDNINESKERYLSLTETENGTNLEILNNYENRTLGERYSNLCVIASYIYMLFIENNQKSLQTTRQNVLNGSCEKTVRQRLNNEMTYTKAIKIKSANALSLVNVQEYVSYLGKRMEDLKLKIAKATASFQRIERGTTEITPSCS